MSPKHYIAICIGLTVFIIIAFMLTQKNPILSTSEPCPDFTQGQAVIGEHTLQVGFVRTPEAKARGLSHCPRLPDNAGLVFVFDPPRPVRFWMKDMLIPIDIIWIEGGQIVGIESNLPPPPPNTSDDDLQRYRPDQSVDTVLEVAAGTATEHNWQVGDHITITEG